MRLLSFLLVAMMMVSLLGVGAFAGDTANDASIVVENIDASDSKAETNKPTVTEGMDFTSSEAAASGEGWAWDSATKTLSLKGVSVQTNIVLPDGSTIYVEDGTESDVAVESGNAIYVDGSLTINGAGKLSVASGFDVSDARAIRATASITVKDTELSAQAECAVAAPSVSITDSKVDLYGYYYGIHAKTTTGEADSTVALKNVSGKIAGYGYGGINAHSETANVSVELDECHDLEIYNEVENDSTSVNFNFAGIRAYTRGSGKDATVSIAYCEDVTIQNSTMAILAANNANAADAEAAESMVYIKESKGIKLVGNTSCYSAVFVNNYGVENDDSAVLSIANSEVEVLAPNATALMTSTKSAPSNIEVVDSDLLIDAGLVGFRTIATDATYTGTSIDEDSTVKFMDYPSAGFVDESVGGTITPDTSYTDFEVLAWYDPNATEYTINSIDDLLAFAKAVNDGDTFEGKTVKLGSDLNLAGLNWTPIGNDTNYFWGTFDGQGHTISNMTINVNTPDANQFVGLFGGVRKATLKNFKMTNVNIDVVGAKVRAAAVVAIAHSNSENHTTANINLENITVDGCVINAEAKSNSLAVGGLSGYCYPANMTDISVSNLTINPKASGSVFAGGLVGYMQGQNISNNGNTRAYYTVDGFTLKNITINSETNDSLIGGFAGYTYYGYITLKNATIEGFKVEVDVAKEALVGGLIGLAHRSDKGHTFTDVEITGIDFDITSDSGVDVIVGGMVGYSGSPIAYADCSVSGAITETVRNDTSSAIVGGFVGGTVSWAQTFEKCTADVDINASNIAGGFVGSNGVTATYTDCEAKGTVDAKVAGGFAGGSSNATYINCSYTGESDVLFLANHVVQVGTTYYKTLKEAVAAANAIDGDATVTLLADVTIGEMLTISGNVTISGAYTITWADGYNGTLFNVANGATLTLKDVTIDGENAFTFYDDTTTVEDGQNWYTRFVDVGEEDKAINDNVIVNAGNLTLDSVCITGVTIASDGDNGKTENTESGYVLKYNDDLALIKSNGGSVTLSRANLFGNAGMVLNAINAETVIENSIIDGNFGCGNKGGIIIASGGTMELNNASICGNKAMARSATVLGVINGAEVEMNGNTRIDNNKHIGVGSNTAGAMIVLEGASQFVMNGGSISNNIGGRAGAIASRWVGGSYGQHEDTSIVLNAGTIKGNTASNDSWNGASVFLRSPATIGEGMKIDGTIAVNAAPGALEITGGTFTGSLTVTDGLVAEISGGTFDYDPTEWLVDGYVAPKNDDGTYSVRSQTYVEWIKAELLAGNSVTLDRDVVITDYDLVNALVLPSNGNGKYTEAHGNGAVFHVIKPGVVLDLNGHSITWDAHDDYYCNKRQVSLFMVTITGNPGETADLTIIDSSAAKTGKVEVYGMGTGLYVVGVDAKGTISGGTWTNYPCKTCGASNIFIYPTHGGELYITDGTFEQKESDYLIGWNGSSKPTTNNGVGIDQDATKVYITGGIFVGFNPETDVKFIDTANGSAVSEVNGCELGYMAKDNGDGTYGIQEWDLVIRNADDLLRFVAMANAGNNFSGKTVTLMADINLGGMTWTPIKNFLGTFNGNKHTISNFHLDATKSHAGFFYKIDFGNGTAIKDLTLSDITATVGNYYVGALAYFSFAVQDNITIKNFDVTTVSSEANIGGYAGWVEWGHIRNCTIENMTVHAENGAGLIGGLAAVLKADSWLQYNNIDVNGFKVTIHDTDGKYAEVGGLVGQTQTGHDAPVFTNCDITGIDVTASGLVTVGGFIARPGAHTTAKNCTTAGKIDVTGVTSPDESAGGFFGNLGWNNNESSRGGHKLTDCSANVDIITKIAPAGGFVGSATNEQNRNMAVAFTNCKALGTITCVEGGTAYIGGFAGDADRGTYKNCSAAQDPFIGYVYAGSKLVNENSYVASVGNAYYADFENAVAAAQAGDIKDIVLHAPVVITEDTTLDLTGLTVDGNGVYPAFRIQNGANVTVKGGTVTNSDYVFVLGASDGSSAGNLTIESGSYTGTTSVISVTKGTLTVLGGEFKAAESEYGATYLLNCIDGNYKDGSAKIIVKGGTFYGFDPKNNAAEGAETNFCANNYTTTEADDVFTVVVADPFNIYTVDDLFEFAALANSGNNFSGWTVNLMADIDLGGMTWTPIASFAGNFVGNNHIISNFHIDATSASGGFFNVIASSNGLEDVKVKDLILSDVTATVGNARFGTLANSIQGVVHNVTVKNITVTTTHTNAWVGGMAAFMSWPWMTNCTVENLVVDATAGADLIGGFACILQKNSNHVFDNLDVKGFKVTVTDTDASGCGVGGFVAQTQRGWENPKIINSDITGIDITASGLVDVGGFIAWPGAHTIAENCHTSGKIDVTGVTSADCFAGGFFGNLGWNADLGQMGHKVTDCSADVDIVTKVAPAGGFVGSATNSNNNSMYATFTDCVAKGDVTVVEGGTANIGGFAGNADRGMYTDCVAEGTLTNNGTGYTGGFIGYIKDTTPKYDGRYPAGTRDYLVDVLTFDTCKGSVDPFIGAVADTKPASELINKDSYVASVGNAYYADFENAVAAAQAGDIKDIVLHAPVVITEDTTLDLTGLTVDGNGVYPAFRIQNGANVTVKGGTVTNSDYVFVLGASDGSSAGNLTIESGSYTGTTSVISVTKGTLTVLGGEFKAAESEYGATYLLNCIDGNYKDGSAKIIVKGGTFYGFDPKNNAAEGAETNFCANNYTTTEADDVFTVVVADPFNIYTVDDLFEFAALANSGNNFSGWTVNLMADIDLGGMTWTPIASFAGNFVGNNHIISNFHIDATSASGGFFNVIASSNGLEDVKVKDLILSDVTATVGNARFGTLANSIQGVVHNVTVKNITVTTTHTNAWVGGMAAFMSWPWMTNCTVENLVVDATAGADLIGGFACILQKNSNHVFDNLDVKGFKVTVTDTDASGCGVGGFVAQTQRGWENPKIINSDITGIDITASGLVDVGGFIAWPGAHTIAENCHTSGKIDVTGVTSADCFAGGFFGNLGWNADLGQMGHKVTDCSADVDIVTKVAPAGGFVGSATNSNNNSMYATFNNCAASGDITAVEGATADIGGFFGDGDRGVYNNCSASGTVTNNGTGYAGQFGGALYDVTPKYDGRYPAGTRDYLVDEITLDGCYYTGISDLKFIGNVADGVDVTIIKCVATVTDADGNVTYYKTFDAALEAATEGDTITLLESVVISEDTTLDLTGKTLDGNGITPAFRVVDGATLTVKGGNFLNATGYLFILGASDGSSAGNVIIEDGSYEACITIASVTKGTLTVLGGEFKIAESSYGATYMLNCIDANYKDGSAKITVMGGTFYGFDPENNVAEGANTSFVTDGYCSVEDEGVYTVVKAVAKVDGIYYATFAEALAAAQALNATTTDTVVIEVYTTIVLDEDGVYDLDGIRINAVGITNAPVFRVLADVTFTGGIVDGRGPVAGEGGINCYAFIVGNSETAGTLTITGGTYRGVTSAISITNGTVNISGGIFQTDHDNEGTDYGATYLLNCMDAAYKNGNAVYNITGGRFNGFNPENNAAEGAGTNFVADGYKASDYYDNDKWYVAEANVVMDGDKYFATIKDALAILASADTTVHTVKVLKDLTIDVNYSTYNYPILVNGFAIELDLNGKTITADWSTYTGSRVDNALIGVCNGGKLDIIDSVGGGKIINNDNKANVENRIFWIMTSTATKSLVVNIKGGTFVQNDVNTALLYVQGNRPSDNLAPMYVNITGGHFETVNDDFFNAYDGYQHESYITGGTFNKNPTDWEIKIHPDYAVVENEDGTFGVLPKTYVTVTIDDKNMVVGNTVPEFTYTLSDSALADKITVNFEAITVNGVGTYTITATVDADAMYEVTVVDGTLTVVDAIVSVTANGATTYYADFDSAWNAALNARGYVNFRVLANITLDKTYVFDSPTGITLEIQDGMKYTITSTHDGPMFRIEKGTRMAVKNIIIDAKGDAFYVNGSTLSLQGVGDNSQRTILKSQTGNVVYLRGGNVTIQGGVTMTAYGEYPAIQGNGNYAGNVTIQKWGSYIGIPQISAPNSDMAIYWPQNGTLTISEAVIEGKTAIWAKSGTINISGGTFIATGDKAAYAPNNNGASATGDAVVIEASANTAYELPVVNITGGTFQSANGEAVAYYTEGESKLADENFITGGTFSSDVSDLCEYGYGAEPQADGTYVVKPMIVITIDDQNMVAGNLLPEFTFSVETFDWTVTGSINGLTANTDGKTVGTFEINGTPVAIDGYYVKVVPGTLTVVKAVLSVNGVYFASWDDAKASFSGNGLTATIVFYDNIENTVGGFGANSNITIDLNGYKWHMASGGAYYNTTVTVVNNGANTASISMDKFFSMNSMTVFNLVGDIDFDGAIQMTYNSGSQKVGYFQINGENIIGEDNSLFVADDSTVRLTLKNDYLYVSTEYGHLTLTKDWATKPNQIIILGSQTGVIVPENVTLTIDPTTSLTLKGYLKGEGTVVVSSAEHLTQIMTEATVANIKLGDNITADVTVDREVVLDLNGKTLTGALTVAENGKLTVVDSTITDNFDDAGSVIGDVTVNGKLTLYAGTYSEDVTDYCAQYYIARDNKNGTWTVCYGFVYNETSGKTFATIAEAMADARTNKYDHDVIILLQDHEESIVIIYDGTTLDLQTYTLEADYVVSFAGGYITGAVRKSSDTYAKLIVPKQFVALAENAATLGSGYVLPIWDKEENGYVFGQLGTSTIADGERDSERYTGKKELFTQFVINGSTYVKKTLMLDQASSGLHVEVVASWNPVDRDGNALDDTITQVYRFSDESLYKSLVENYDLVASVLLDGHENLTMYIRLVSDTGVVVNLGQVSAN